MAPLELRATPTVGLQKLRRETRMRKCILFAAMAALMFAEGMVVGSEADHEQGPTHSGLTIYAPGSSRSTGSPQSVNSGPRPAPFHLRQITRAARFRAARLPRLPGKSIGERMERRGH